SVSSHGTRAPGCRHRNALRHRGRCRNVEQGSRAALVPAIAHRPGAAYGMGRIQAFDCSRALTRDHSFRSAVTEQPMPKKLTHATTKSEADAVGAFIRAMKHPLKPV